MLFIVSHGAATHKRRLLLNYLVKSGVPNIFDRKTNSTNWQFCAIHGHNVQFATVERKTQVNIPQIPQTPTAVKNSAI
jgi:hypothetical protein